MCIGEVDWSEEEVKGKGGGEGKQDPHRFAVLLEYVENFESGELGERRAHDLWAKIAPKGTSREKLLVLGQFHQFWLESVVIESSWALFWLATLSEETCNEDLFKVVGEMEYRGENPRLVLEALCNLAFRGSKEDVQDAFTRSGALRLLGDALKDLRFDEVPSILLLALKRVVGGHCGCEWGEEVTRLLVEVCLKHFFVQVEAWSVLRWLGCAELLCDCKAMECLEEGIGLLLAKGSHGLEVVEGLLGIEGPARLQVGEVILSKFLPQLGDVVCGWDQRKSGIALRILVQCVYTCEVASERNRCARRVLDALQEHFHSIFYEWDKKEPSLVAEVFEAFAALIRTSIVNPREFHNCCRLSDILHVARNGDWQVWIAAAKCMGEVMDEERFIDRIRPDFLWEISGVFGELVDERIEKRDDRDVVVVLKLLETYHSHHPLKRFHITKALNQRVIRTLLDYFEQLVTGKESEFTSSILTLSFDFLSHVFSSSPPSTFYPIFPALVHTITTSPSSSIVKLLTNIIQSILSKPDGGAGEGEGKNEVEEKMLIDVFGRGGVISKMLKSKELKVQGYGIHVLRECAKDSIVVKEVLCEGDVLSILHSTLSKPCVITARRFLPALLVLPPSHPHPRITPQLEAIASLPIFASPIIARNPLTRSFLRKCDVHTPSPKAKRPTTPEWRRLPKKKTTEKEGEGWRDA